MAKDNVIIMKKWIDDIVNDENLDDINEQKIAYILYAAVMYGFSGEKINIGAVFGKEFGVLNYAMSNIYGQIDNIKNYDPSDGNNIKYDSETIKELRLKGYKAKEICIELGYPADKAKSLTSNKGWIEAGKILKEQKEKSVQNSTENTESVQTKNTEKVVKIPKKTDSVQICTDMAQTENTEKDRSVQKSVQKVAANFDF